MTELLVAVWMSALSIGIVLVVLAFMLTLAVLARFDR